MDYATTIVLFICAFTVKGYPLNKAEEQPLPPKPYVFSYTAGRMPGHVDRVHSETSDGLGVIRGMFSYLDPRQQIRTVEYIADQNGFHPLLITNPTQDTRAVQNAKAKHQVLFSQIAADHERVALERGQNNQGYVDDGSDVVDASDTFDPNILISHPQDTPVVERAKLRHYDLYNKIALEHAKIAAERGDTEEHQEPQESKERVVKIGFIKY